MSDINAILEAWVAATYGAPIVNKACKAPKVKASKVPNKALKVDAPLAVSKETAKVFMMAMRSSSSLEERQAAIAAFIGYDRSVDYGTQEMRANSAARRALYGAPDISGPSRAERRAASNLAPSIDSPASRNVARRRADLLQREKQCAARIAHFTFSGDEHSMLALQLEEQRLLAIRKELRELGW